MTTPPDPMLDYLRDAAAKLGAVLPEGHTVAYDTSPIRVVKHAAFLPVSDDVLMDAGVIPDTRPPVHIPWHRRARWRWQEWRERVGRKVGGWIAGVDLSERDDW